jgi:hypothetical protein
MQEKSQTPVFEVHCHRCNVTFPVGARHCMHCGGRLSKQPGVPLHQHASLYETENVFELDEAPPEEVGRRSPFSPIAVIWVLLFVAGTLYRACTSG